MVEYIGRLTRVQVNELYGKCRAGIVLYQPAANHYDSQPIKMFEYMAAGLPVVASNFPLWKEIIELNHCGICVEPTNSEAVRAACMSLIKQPETAQKMGRLGYAAILNKYNWTAESQKLIELYKQLEH